MKSALIRTLSIYLTFQLRKVSTKSRCCRKLDWRNNMSKNWNKIWRWIHLAMGLMLVIYHSRIAYLEYGWVDSAWSSEIDSFVSTTFVFMVMWTGLAKWPIYPWYKKRQNKKKREEKAAVAE